MKPMRSLPLPAAALLGSQMLAILSCQIHLGGPEPPGQPLVAASGQAEELIEIWEDALSVDPLTGEVMVKFTEQQLTSYLAQRLDSIEDPFLSRPQVHLREGELQVYGVASRGPFKAGVVLMIAPLLDEEGSIAFEVTSADFGPFPAPTAVKDTLSAILTEAFTGTLGPLATGLHITSFAIADGQVAIVGKLR